MPRNVSLSCRNAGSPFNDTLRVGSSQSNSTFAQGIAVADLSLTNSKACRNAQLCAFCTLVRARAAIRTVPVISTVMQKPCAFGYLASNVSKALSRALVSGNVMNDVSVSSRFAFGLFCLFTTYTCTSPPNSAAAKFCTALMRCSALPLLNPEIAIR